MRQLLTLNRQGKLALRSGAGNETVIEPRPNNEVLLLLDTSGSMAGRKWGQAQTGAIEFAGSARRGGYATALAVFADRAAMVCDPVLDETVLTRKIMKLSIGVVGGSTNLAAGLFLAGKFKNLAAVVVVTDGVSNDNKAALDSAGVLKSRGVEIICIGTDDADQTFLAALATRSELASYVPAHALASAIAEASRMLP